MSKFNLFRRPVEKETQDDWAKIALDVSRVAIIAVPAIIYDDRDVYLKVANIIGLLFITYIGLTAARFWRTLKQEN